MRTAIDKWIKPVWNKQSVERYQRITAYETGICWQWYQLNGRPPSDRGRVEHQWTVEGASQRLGPDMKRGPATMETSAKRSSLLLNHQGVCLQFRPKRKDYLIYRAVHSENVHLLYRQEHRGDDGSHHRFQVTLNTCLSFQYYDLEQVGTYVMESNISLSTRVEESLNTRAMDKVIIPPFSSLPPLPLLLRVRFNVQAMSSFVNENHTRYLFPNEPASLRVHIGQHSMLRCEDMVIWNRPTHMMVIFGKAVWSNAAAFKESKKGLV